MVRVSITQGDAVAVYVVGGRTSTTDVHAGQTARPPTTAGGPPVISPIPPAEINTINRMIDEATHGAVTTTTTTGQQILTVGTPILEQIQGADRAKVENSNCDRKRCNVGWRLTFSSKSFDKPRAALCCSGFFYFMMPE
jgi:translation initiation factor IF-1